MALIYSSSDPSIDIAEGLNILAEQNGVARFISSDSIQSMANITPYDQLESNKGNSKKYPSIDAMIKYCEANKATGPRGYQGFQGNTGSQGPQGHQGAQGAQGAAGGSGGAGSQGPQGNRGYQGYQGAQGAAGATGSDYWQTNKTECSGSSNLGADYNIYGVAFYQGSDKRLKTDISEINGALDKISNIPIVKYKYNGNEKVHIGTIAQDIKDIVPEVVSESDNDNHYLSVNYPELAMYGIAAIKELVTVLKSKKIL